MPRVKFTGTTGDEEIPINTDREYAIHTGENLANHSTAKIGRAKFVRVGPNSMSGDFPIFRTKQAAYRFVAWLLLMVEKHELPDEDGAYSFDEVSQAIREQ